MGHVRDLPKSTLGVDIENNFNPKYITIGKGELMAKLKKEAKSAKRFTLQPTPTEKARPFPGTFPRPWALMEKAHTGWFLTKLQRRL